MSNGDRDGVELIRSRMLREMQFATLGGSFANPGYLVDAKGAMWSALNCSYGYFDRPNYAEIARRLGVGAEHLRLTLQGRREPSKAILEAIGYERVIFYRKTQK